MTRESRTVASLKGQMSKFSGIISKEFNKAKRRLIKEMLNGIQSSEDVKLSNISRTLKEDQTLLKTEDRLSRNLDHEDFTDPINGEIVRLGASYLSISANIFQGKGGHIKIVDCNPRFQKV